VIEKPSVLEPPVQQVVMPRQAVDLLMCEKILLGLYPRLHFQAPNQLFTTLRSMMSHDLRRIVHIYCGDGLITNWLALHFPKTEIIGIDPDRNKIAIANCTVGQRGNIRFIAGDPRSLDEIPCERILYSNPFSQNSQALAFKKMFMKTQSWLVDEGDWIIEESLSAALLNGSLFNENLLAGEGYFSQLNHALSDIGYFKTHTLNQDSLFGMLTSVIIQAPTQRAPLFDAPRIRQKPEIVSSRNFAQKPQVQKPLVDSPVAFSPLPRRKEENTGITKGIHFGKQAEECTASKAALDDIFALSSSSKSKSASPHWDM